MIGYWGYDSSQDSQVYIILLCLGDGIVTKLLPMHKVIEDKEELHFRLVESEGSVETANRKYTQQMSRTSGPASERFWI